VTAAAGPAVNAALAGRSAMAGTKAAGRAVAAVAERTKTPFIIGGAAAGVAGGLMLQRRRSRSGTNGLSGIFRDGQLDLGAIAAAARKAGDVGQQLGDIGKAIERTQGKKD
jgi:hypothetical protein